MMLFACSEAVESKLVKLETSHTVILPPKGECSLALGSKARFKCTVHQFESRQYKKPYKATTQDATRDYLKSFLALGAGESVIKYSQKPKYPSRPGFEQCYFYFLLNEPFPATFFSIQLTKQTFDIDFGNDWIRTTNLRFQKRRLYQLSHNHCPKLL